MFVLEDRNRLWLARANPRAWLAQDKKISVTNAPSCLGTVAYELVSDVDHAAIRATVELPFRRAPQAVLLRFRHPKAARIRSVEVSAVVPFQTPELLAYQPLELVLAYPEQACFPGFP